LQLNDPRFVTPREAGGLGMDAQWSDDFHHALFAALTGLTEGYYADFGAMAQLAKSLKQTFVYDGLYSRYRKRVHGRPVLGLSQHRFLGYIQNHDQVGNRAIGDRISHIAGIDGAKIAAAVVLTSPFVPMIFQGEEWAASSPFQFFADHEPELAKLVSEGRRKEFAAFGWDPELIPDPESRETFERSKLKWEEASQSPHAQMLAWYRDLIRLRRSTPALNNGEPGNVRVIFDEQEKWIRIERGTVTIAANIGKSDHAFDLPEQSRSLLASSDRILFRSNRITLPPDAVAVLESAQS
jgi:maltooligosyltrehalose trehalohydrolase